MNRNVYATILIILAVGVYFTVTKSILADAGIVADSNTSYANAISGAKQVETKIGLLNDDRKNISNDNVARLEKMVPENIDGIRLLIDLNNFATVNHYILNGITVAGATPDKKTASVSTPSQTNPATPNPMPGSPDSGAVPTTGQALTAASNSSQLNLGALASVTQPKQEKVTISFGVTATYQQFIALLQKLESSLRILDVTGISLSSIDDKSNGVYNWSVTMQTYWLHNQ